MATPLKISKLRRVRSWAMLRPVLAGLALDALDLATAGPIGLWTGMIVGTVGGYFLAPSLGFSERRRWLCALLAGVYCTLPTTAFVPLASVLATAARIVGGQPKLPEGDRDEGGDPGDDVTDDD